MKYPQTKTRTSAFTIIELLIVIVIIAILAAITLIAYNGIQARAQAATAQTDAKSLAKLLALANVSNSTYPTDLSTINNGGPLPSNDGTTYVYHQQNSGANYCVTVTNGGSSYIITDTNTTPIAGGCPGDGVGGQAAITNLSVNPSLETSSTGWSPIWGTSGNGTSVRMTNGGKNGNAYWRMTWSTAPTVTWGGVQPPAFPITVGQAYSTSIWVRTSSPQTLRLILRADNYPTTPDAGGPIINVPANTWTQLTVTDPSVPSGASTLYNQVVRAGSGSWQPGDILDTDALMITQGSSQYNYADGNSPSWIWNGAVNTSTSTGPAQ